MYFDEEPLINIFKIKIEMFGFGETIIMVLTRVKKVVVNRHCKSSQVHRQPRTITADL